ncbi:very-long-chain (3R)-3-hydroxyacyl-CoA dehydratase 3 [Aplysia californica]|uniref:Very-long-chain (3R)-3-hydroxyacyl-CoA dehydratase n=1 Tax=Aplysia californica TaxID=6500 RepID=A0ABM0JBA8_APLCA|nr:very-long-chain (3R)-3-hydroxyacyl-CoA dehydratase 3 [Aplysia californica]
MATVLSPFVYWGQSNETLSLKVDLRNVENVDVSLTEETLDFSSQGLGVKGVNNYGFHLDFYLPVDPEKSRYRKTDLAVEFQIEKSAGETWPRLTADRMKLPWLKIDFDKFPVDDSEEESDISSPEQAQEALLKKITTEFGNDSSSKTEKNMSLSQTYLFLYNLFQFVGYTYIFVILLYQYIRTGESAKQAAFETTGSQMMVCQIIAVLEVIHPMIGLIKSNFIMSLAQVMGRNLILFLLVLQEPRLQISPMCWYLFVVWSCVEVIRYPFYLLQIAGLEIKTLTWLRYTIWIPLYPLGILIEATIVVMSISFFAETGYFSIELPNSANFAFYFPYFLATYLVLMAVGGTNNLSHMRNQRQKQLYGKSSSKSKVKSS